MVYTRALENNLSDIGRKYNINRLRDILLICDIEIEVDKIRFHLTSDGSSAVITFNRIAEAFALIKKLAEITDSFDDKRKGFEEFLRNNGLTIYIQNRHFGILGQNANKILARTAAVAGRFFSG